MKINLITTEEHEALKSIYSNFPALTFQNKGYEGINRENLTEEERGKIKEIEEILKKSVFGFSKFQNFKKDKEGNAQIRVQYDYSADDKSNSSPYFIGVGYLKIDELKNGFN